jgi:hypothetical protein
MTYERVVWVVDPDFGDEALLVAEGCPVWAVSSPTNEATSKRARAAGLSFTLLTASGATREEWLINHIDSLDQHHNEFSQTPGYKALRVVGTPATQRVQEWFGEFGFTTFNAESNGFVAHKA